jgi:AraC-like DNA-binding protein
MHHHTLLVKNMVCQRCIMAVENILQQHAVPYTAVSFGEIHLKEEISEQQRTALAAALEQIGFEVIGSHVSGLVEKIKQHIIRKARNEVSGNEQKLKLSNYLSSLLNYEYTHLSSLFSSVEGRTIENFFIEQRIEKAKELLVYGQRTLSEIAEELDYSSTAHLSGQFKKVTGLTPSHFKEIGAARRKAIDKV